MIHANCLRETEKAKSEAAFLQGRVGSTNTSGRRHGDRNAAATGKMRCWDV
jgi:hypothetical protein